MIYLRNLIVVLLLLCCLGCGDKIATNPDRIVIGTTSQIRTLDPADAYEFFSGNILVHLTDRLYTYRPGTTELMPQLATDFPKISADGLVYRIPIRSGVKFHDGTDFDSKAMAFSLTRFIAAEGAPAFLLKDVIDRVEAPNPLELVIYLKAPLPFFLKLLAFTGAGAVSPKAYSDQKSLNPEMVVGTGPYQLTAYSPGNILRLQRFPKYWGTPAKNSAIDIQFISSSANLLNAFKTGAVDLAFQTLSPYQVHNLEQKAPQSGWQVISGASSTILYMTLNVMQPPLSDVRVRQALALAIDRELVGARVFMGQRSPLYSLVPNTLSQSRATFQQLYDNGKPERARKLLQAAGYSPDRPAEIALWFSPRYAGNGDLVASTLKASIERNLGDILHIKIERVEPTTAYALIDQGVYPAFLFDWVPDILDADNFTGPFLSCDRQEKNYCVSGSSHFQGSFYYDPELDNLIKRQRQEQNPDRRQELLDRIQILTAEAVPFIPLWQNREYVFAQSNIQGVSLEPTQILPFSTLEKLPMKSLNY